LELAYFLGHPIHREGEGQIM